MCDSYVLNPGDNFYSRFNVINKLPSFPKDPIVQIGQIQPVITFQEGLTLIWVMKWGLIPSWAKERGVGDRMYNVSANSLLTKIGFKQAFRNNRCLIPASAFVKHKITDGTKKSYLFSPEYNPLFSFAGIYDIWQEPVSGHEVYSYSIVTVPSNHQIKPFGDTMPLILKSQDEKTWLDYRTPTFKLESLFKTPSPIFNQIQI